MIHKQPIHPKRLRQVRRKCLDPKGLRGVVAAVEQIDAKLLGGGVTPVRAFPGDKGIDALRGHGGNFTTRAAGADTEMADDFAAAWTNLNRTAQGFGQAFGEGGAIELDLETEADRGSLIRKGGRAVFQAEGAGEECVVPKFGMGVEREVLAEDGEIVVHGQLQLAIRGAGDGLQAGPEQAVMDEEEIGSGGNRLFHDGEMGIDGGGDPGDRAGVFQLEAVDRARVIGDFSGPEQLVDVGDDFGEGGHDDFSAGSPAKATGEARGTGASCIRMRPLLSFALVLCCSAVLAGEAVSLRVGPRVGMEVSEAAGVWTITTIGGNPHFLTTAIPAEAAAETHPILSFEYFAAAPLPNLTVRLPLADGVKHHAFGPVPLAETWKPFAVDLRLAGVPYASGPGRSFALILGTAVGHQFQLRNLQLRAPNAEEERSSAERERVREAREAAGQSWLAGLRRTYPGRIQSVTVGELEITLTADVSGRLQEVWADPTDQTDPTDLIIPRFSGKRDRATSGWRIVDDQGNPLTRAAYADQWSGQRNLPKLTATSIKGLGGIPMGLTAEHEIFDLGIEHATVNMVVNALLGTDAKPGWSAWDFEGRTFYLNAGYLNSLDATVRTLSQKQIIVSAILLIGNHRDAAGRPTQPMVHPDALPEGTFAMPDLGEAYRAVIHLLTERYTRDNGEFGRISNWILHNEVNQAGTWTNMGEQPLPRYVETYLRSCRMVYQSARRFDPHARVFTSLTHHWTKLSGGPQTYVVRDLLDLFAEAARVEGDFEWGVAYHPYPEPMRQPDVWTNQVSYDFDTEYITPKNIEVLAAYLAQPQFLYQGKPRGILLSEQGINARSLTPEDQRLQAAGIAYTMSRVRQIPAIEAYHYHAYRDAPEAEGGLLLGLTNREHGHKLAWDVYAAFATDREKAAFAFAWPIVGIPGPEALTIQPVR